MGDPISRLRERVAERKGKKVASYICSSLKLQKFLVVNQEVNVRVYYQTAPGLTVEPNDVRNMLSYRNPHIQRNAKTFSGICFLVSKTTVTLSTGGVGNSHVRINLAGNSGVEGFCMIIYKVAKMMEACYEGKLKVVHVAHEVGNNVIVINPSEQGLAMGRIMEDVPCDKWRYEPDEFPGLNIAGGSLPVTDAHYSQEGDEDPVATTKTTTKKIISFTTNYLNCLGNRDLGGFMKNLPHILGLFRSAEVEMKPMTPQERSKQRQDEYKHYLSLKRSEH